MACASVCARKFLHRIMMAQSPRYPVRNSCNECGHCLLICPANAITHKNIHPDRIREISKDPLPSFAEVDTLMKCRRSIRNFADEPVEKELIEKIIDSARFAPSAKNTQSTFFHHCQRPPGIKTSRNNDSRMAGQVGGKIEKSFHQVYISPPWINDTRGIERWIGQFELTARNMEKGIDTILYNAPALIVFHADRHIRFAEANANLALHNGTLAACTL